MRRFAPKEITRRLLSRFITAWLRLRSRPLVLENVARSLILAPHQDDEALGCAGLIKAHLEQGLPIDVVYLTDGSGSHPGHPILTPAAICTLRHTEAIAAMKELGLSADHLHFLNAPDGRLNRLHPDEAELLQSRLATILSQLHPSSVYLPCRRDGSSEHDAAFILATAAIARAQIAPRLLEYPIWARWNPLRLFKTGLSSQQVWRLEFSRQQACKRTALTKYVSQMEPTPPWPGAVLPAGFVRIFSAAEEFFFESSR